MKIIEISTFGSYSCRRTNFFVRKPPSILLDIDIFLDHQCRAVQLSMAAQLRRFCVGLAYKHPGGTASRILQVRDRAS